MKIKQKTPKRIKINNKKMYKKKNNKKKHHFHNGVILFNSLHNHMAQRPAYNMRKNNLKCPEEEEAFEI